MCIIFFIVLLFAKGLGPVFNEIHTTLKPKSSILLIGTKNDLLPNGMRNVFDSFGKEFF